MNSLEILRAMGPDNYKKNSLKLAEEILEKLRDLAPKLISKYERNSEVCEWNKRSNQKSINEIMEIMGKIEGKEVSDTYGEPIKFTHKSQFREPFSLRVDLVIGKVERYFIRSESEHLVNIGEDLWQMSGAGFVGVEDVLSKEQINLLQLIDYKQKMKDYHHDYISAKERLNEYSISLENIDLTEFNEKLDQANTEYWESRKALRDLGIYPDTLREDKEVAKKKTEIEYEIAKFKERAKTAKWNYETRKKNLEDQGLDPDKFDLWGTTGK